MIVTHNITIDLLDKGAVPQVDATQDDQYTRNLAIALMEGKTPWTIPEDAAAVIRYRKGDGVGGEYDTLPDGTAAWWAEGNVLTLALAPQVLTCPGTVMVSATLIREEEVISIFSVAICVRHQVRGIFAESAPYYNVAGFLPGPVKAAVGQYLRVAGVDDRGRVVVLEAADAPAGETAAPLEPREEDIPRVYFGAALPQTKEDTVMSFRYISGTEDIRGWCKTKAQGNSSMSYPKKNQTVKLYADADCTEKLKMDFKGWGEQNKFCFKANWIDLTHARNIVSARLWADVVRSRANYDSIPEPLRTSPNQGVVDGFPVKVYADGIYQGRYTLNIPKDAWMANMDDELDTHCILCGENYTSGCFRAEANIDGTDWTDEIHDTVPVSVRNRWNEAIRFVMNSTDEEFVSGISSYFDVESLIDYYIFGVVSCGLDAFGKNQLYMTYDGLKWYAQMYDMDATWGLWWDGSEFVGYDYDRGEFEDFNGRSGNLLYIRLEALFADAIRERWETLKDGALSMDSVIDRFERFADIAPPELVAEDYAVTTGSGAFTAIPLAEENNIWQLRGYIRDRYRWLEEQFFAGDTGDTGEEEPADVLLYSDYSPNGAVFSTQTAIDWENQYLEASVDLTASPAGNPRIVLSVGQDITVWPGIACMHVYYSIGKSELRVQFFTADGSHAYLYIPFTEKHVLLRLDKGGVTVNGTAYTAADFDSPDNYATALAQIRALEAVTVGAVEGSDKSCATYEYVAVRYLRSTVLYSDYSPNGTVFSTETAIDWTRQYVEASVDLTASPAGNPRIVLSVGQDITVWPGIACMHVYYSIGKSELRVQFFNTAGSPAYLYIPFTEKQVLLRLDSSGVTVNGTAYTAADFDSADNYTAALADILALGTVSIGAVQGSDKSCATYEYIMVGQT